jgi:hypothetical protein
MTDPQISTEQEFLTQKKEEEKRVWQLSSMIRIESVVA